MGFLGVLFSLCRRKLQRLNTGGVQLVMYVVCNDAGRKIKVDEGRRAGFEGDATSANYGQQALNTNPASFTVRIRIVRYTRTMRGNYTRHRGFVPYSVGIPYTITDGNTEYIPHRFTKQGLLFLCIFYNSSRRISLLMYFRYRGESWCYICINLFEKPKKKIPK